MINKLNLDPGAMAYLEDICSLSPEFKVDANLCMKLLDNNILKRTYQDDECRDAAGRACAALLAKYNEKANDFFDKIIEMYQNAYVKSEPKTDDLGRKKLNPLKDSYSDQRLTLATMLIHCIPHATLSFRIRKFRCAYIYVELFRQALCYYLGHSKLNATWPCNI